MSAFNGLDNTFFTRLNCVLWQFWRGIRKYDNPGIIQSMSAYMTRQTGQCNGHCKHRVTPIRTIERKKPFFFVAYSINHTFYSWQIFKTNGFSSCICIKKADLKENVVRRRDWASLFQSSLNKEGFNICQLCTKIKDFPVQFVHICHACIDIKIRKFFYRIRESYS